jgi:hypothetical protein
MDNLGSSNPQRDNREGSNPAGNKADEPIRLEESPTTVPPAVSRAPLNLGGGAPAPAPTPTPAPTPATSPAAPPAPAPAAKAAAPVAAPRPVAAAAPRPAVPGIRPAGPKPVATRAISERITTCKVFFTKLHPGAIKFLEEQITGWLKDNPSVTIKSTDVIMGDVQEKKTEPNIVIVVWY